MEERDAGVQDGRRLKIECGTAAWDDREHWLRDCSVGRDGSLAAELQRGTRWDIGCGTAAGDAIIHWLQEGSV